MRFGVGYERLVGEPRTTGRASRRPRCGPPGSLLRSPFAGSPRLRSISGGRLCDFTGRRLCGFTGRRLRRLSGNFRRDLSGPDRRLTVRPEIFQSRRLRRLPCGRSEERPPPRGGCLPGDLLPGQPHRPCKGVPYGFRLRGLRYGNRGCSVFRHRCDNSPIIFQRLVRPEQEFTRNGQDQHGSGCGGNPRPVDPPYGPAGFCPGNLRPRSRTAQLALQTLPSPRRRREFGVAKRVPHGFDPILVLFHSSM